MLRFGSTAAAACFGARALSTSALLFAPKAGKVVSWMPGRGYGFIEDHDAKQHHFVHFSSLKVEPGGFRALSVGQEVEFDVTDENGRPRAQNVTAPGGQALPSGERPVNPDGGRGGGGGRGRGGRGGGSSGGRSRDRVDDF